MTKNNELGQNYSDLGAVESFKVSRKVESTK
jgi:hypothetical protein